MTEVPSKAFELCLNFLKEIKIEKEEQVNHIHIRSLISTLRHLEKDNFIPLDSLSNLLILSVEILASGFLSPDNEILLSTALCLLVKTTLNLEKRCNFFCECILANVFLTIKLDFLLSGCSYSVFIQNVDLFRLCLSYSILECFDVDSLLYFYIPNSVSVGNVQKNPFRVVFDGLEKSCMKLSDLTSIYFKLLIVWLRRLNELFSLKLVDLAFVDFHLKKVIFIVSSNWENSLAGIRDKNVEIMKLVFDIIPNNNNQGNGLLVLLETTLIQLPWRMKCKYFVLTAILPKFGVKKALGRFPYIANGLIYSLSFPHLVTAGTDVYKEILKEIQMPDWRHFFQYLIRGLIFGSDRVAKQNLMSHWMPETLKVYPLAINDLLTDLSSDVSSSTLLPLLSLIKLGRKSGMLTWEQIEQKLILECLSHLDEEIRGEVFSIICISTKTTLPPSQTEVDLVSIFLKENINADSARLRQIMICSFKNFISRFKGQYLNLDEHCKSSSENLKKKVDFIQWLKKFIVSSHEPGGNYQRRITSLYLLNIIFEQFFGRTAFKSKMKKYTNNNSQEIFFKNEIKNHFGGGDVLSFLLKCVTDPAEDIRDTASNILKTHFKLPSDDMFPVLWEKALSRCVSSMFYKIESGAVLVDVCVDWALCQPTAVAVGQTFSFFDVLLLHAEKQQSKLEENLLKGALENPVHGILNALHRVLSNHNLHLNMKEMHIKRLILLIDGLVTFMMRLLSSNISTAANVAPSFEEMGVAIDGIILKNVEDIDNIETGELNGAHELVLNCIWLNLKMCCQLASALATAFYENEGNAGILKEEDVERCARLLVLVLMKCRHKGVIESAGKALSIITSFCTKKNNCKLKDIPVRLLTDSLEIIVEREERSEKTSITRRSAGLAILVHKLVAANGKITVPMCVPKLLSWAEIDDIFAFDNKETEDLPQTWALHFLKFIVQDPGLHQNVSPYMSEIALVCFKSFSSCIWTIRNAALQLFGAVVSKLVGQKRMQEEDIVGSNVTVEELNAHHPELVEFILQELKSSVESITHNISPTLLPILALCSRLTVGMPHLLSKSFRKILQEFQYIFLKLLSSPLITVRKSSAKAMSAFTSLPQLSQEIFRLIDSLTERWPDSRNELHGKLLCIKMLRNKLKMDCYLIPVLCTNLEEVQKRIKEMNFTSSVKTMPLFTIALFDELRGFTDHNLTSLVKSKEKLCDSWYPGLPLQSAVAIDLIMLSCAEDDICYIIQQCSACNYMMLESSLTSLLKRINLNIMSETNKTDIIKLLVDLCDLSMPINVMMCCLISISKLGTISTVYLSMEKLENLFTKFIQNISYGIGCSALALPLLSCFIMGNEDLRSQSDFAVKVAITIRKRSFPKCSEDYRLHAGKALNFFTPVFNWKRNLKEDKNNYEEILTCLLDSALLLLQDENAVIRIEAARFVSILMEPESCAFSQVTFNPQHCIDLIFTNIIELLPLKIAVKFLWEKLEYEHSISELKKIMKPTIIKNPFAHGVSNVYAENVIITHIAAEKLLAFIQRYLDCLRYFKSIISKKKATLVKETTTISSLISSKEIDGFHRRIEVYHTLVKIKYQIEILISMRVEGCEELKDIFTNPETCLMDILYEI